MADRGERLAPCIEKLPDGRIRIRVTAKDPATGKRNEMETTLPSNTTLAAAKHERRLLRNTLKNNLERRQATGSVEDYALDWLERKAPPMLKPGTFEWYEDVVAERIIPVIGDVRILDVSRATAQSYVSQIDAIPNYAKSTRRGWWNVCKQLLLDLAADYGLNDPTRRVRGPKRHEPQYNRESAALNREEFTTFMGKFRERYSWRYPEVVCLATTGMRVGEMYGLMWDCVHYEQSRLHICRSASQGVLTESTKNGEVRNAPLWPSLAEHLRERHKNLVRDEHPGLELNLVFPSDVGTPRGSGSIRKPMKLVAEKLELGVAVGPQVLRRTVNTQLREAGINETLVLKQIGHADNQMGLHYARHEAKAMLAAMEGVFGGLFVL